MDGEFGGMGVFWGCGDAADDVMRFRPTAGFVDGVWADVGERDVRINRHRKLRALRQGLKTMRLD